MANIKFSQFTLKTDQADVDYLVGYTGVENVQIEPEKVGVRYELAGASNGGDDYVLSLTDNNGIVENVTLVAGDNIVLTDLAPGQENSVQIDTKRGSVFTVGGTFKNMFGGKPDFFGDTLEFGISSAPAVDHSSVYIVPVDAKLIGVSYKWTSAEPVTGIPDNASYEIQVRPMTNPNGSTLIASNYAANGTIIGGLNLTASANGTFPYRRVATSQGYSAGTIINVSGVEVSGDNIPTSNSEMEVVLTFETTSF